MAESPFPLKSTAIVVPVLALIVLMIDTPAMVWHIKNRNLAASSLVFWILIANLMIFVNAIVWPTDNTASWWLGYGLCDIEVKFQVGLWFGVVGALACIMRNLARVLDTDRTVLSLTQAQRRRQTMIACLLCFGAPIYAMAIHYVVQPYRYYIFAISGCTAAVDKSWVKLVLLLLWPPVLCIVDVYYSILVIVRMRRYRKNFSDILTSSNSNQTKSRFLRLFWMSIILIVVAFPTQIYVLYENSIVPMIPYSWVAIHGSDWPTIELVPSGGTVLFDRWIQIGAGFVLFVFFGLGQDAKAMYRKWLIKAGFDRCFPFLRSQGRAKAQRWLATGSGSRFSTKKSSMNSRSSNDQSVSTTGDAPSPVEPQNGLPQFSAISEIEQKAPYATITSPSADGKHAPQMSNSGPRPWRDHFLVRTHLSALNRQSSARPHASLVPGPGFFGKITQSIYHYPKETDTTSAAV